MSRTNRQWRLGRPQAPGGLSPICDVELKNEWGFLIHRQAQWHQIDRCWVAYPGGEPIERKVYAYDIIDHRYHATQRTDAPVFGQ